MYRVSQRNCVTRKLQQLITLTKLGKGEEKKEKKKKTVAVNVNGSYKPHI